MSANLKRAIAKYGIGEFSRWMLNDGQFLGVYDDDHRIVGEFCTVSWLDFLKKDCVSLHYDGKCGYLGLRVNGDLNFDQIKTFQSLYHDSEFFKVSELYVSVYDGSECLGREEEIRIKGQEACKLWLTDRTSYNLEYGSGQFCEEDY